MRGSVTVLMTVPVSIHTGLQDNLNALILFVHEDVITVRGLLERQAMGDDVARIDLAFLDALKQWIHVLLHMRLARFQSDRTIHE